MDKEEYMVSMTVERYEQLIVLEDRVNVLVDQIINAGYCSIENILRILGTEKAIQKADEIRKEAIFGL